MGPRAILAAALAVAIACQGPLAPAASPSVPGGGAAGLRATFVLANTSGLVALDDSCRPIGRVVELPASSAPATPALRPDGRAIAFTLTGEPSPRTGFGSDIYEVGLDGSGLRPLVEHEAENVFYASPRYDPSGEVVYVHRRAAIVEGGRYVGNEDAIVRVDLRTGEHRKLVLDGGDPTLSVDGRTLVYVKLRDGQPETLWALDTADGTTRPFFRAPDTFFYLQAPRFSPTGDRVVFSAAGRSGAAVAGGRAAHLGIPSDLYVAAADGSSLENIGATGDDVVPLWSPDGTRIAYIGTGTFAIITLADGSLRVCAQGEQFFFGDAVWLR